MCQLAPFLALLDALFSRAQQAFAPEVDFVLEIELQLVPHAFGFDLVQTVSVWSSNGLLRRPGFKVWTRFEFGNLSIELRVERLEIVIARCILSLRSERDRESEREKKENHGTELISEPIMTQFVEQDSPHVVVVASAFEVVGQ